MTQLIDRRTVGSDRLASQNGGVHRSWIFLMRQSVLFREYRLAYEAATGLPLVLREAGSFRPPMEGSKRVNRFCSLMAQANKTCAACLEFQQRVETEAGSHPITLQCHAGLIESAVPVRVGSTVLGYLQTGQVFLRAPSRQQFEKLARGGLGTAGSIKALEAAYFQTRVIPREVYQAVIRLLAVFADHLAAVSNQLLLAKAVAESPVITRSRVIIAEQHFEEIHSGDVARALHMSPFHFCKFFKEGTGLTFTEYLARVRAESAKQMLLNPHMRIGEAGYAAGFQSLSQFNRVFRRVTGESPTRYRSRLHGVKLPIVSRVAVVRAA